MKQIPLLQGKALLVEMPDGAKFPRIETDQSVIPYGQDLTWDINGGDKSYGMDETEWVTLPAGNWRIIGMLSEVTEEQAAELVEKGADNRGDEFGYHDYLGMFHNVRTALESLESTIVSEGYGFDSELEPSYSDCEQYENPIRTYEGRLREWNSRQSRVLDRSRCLLLGRV